MLYTVHARDMNGNTLTFNRIEIPGAGLNTVEDYAQRLASMNMIFLDATPINGIVSSQPPASTGNDQTMINTGVATTANDQGPLDSPGSDQPIYRLVLATPTTDKNYPDGYIYDTGALYPGCNRNNVQACLPIQFASYADVKYYCSQHNEVPVMVSSSDQAWNIVEGKEQVPVAGNSIGILSLLLLGYKLFVGR